MNIKSLLFSNSSQLLEGSKEVSNSFLNTSLNTKSGMFVKVGGQKDALEAVKLDPAVLEAQVTVHDNPKDNGIKRQNHFIDSNKDKEAQPTKIESTTAPKSIKGFEKMVSQSEAALLSLTPQQLELLMKYADMLRRQRIITQRYLECAFCKNNGRPSSWYTSHVLKDERGRVQCPVLRRYRCPRCGATGIYAHTIKYCPEDSQIDTLSCRSGNLF